MSLLSINKRRQGTVVVLDLDGRITLGETSVKLRDSLDDLLDGGSREILANLMEVSYIDSSGLGELVSAFAKAERQGAKLKFVNLSVRVRGILQVTKLITIFETFDNERDALRSFASVRAIPGAS